MQQSQAHKTKYAAADLTFAICAYKESPWLEDCILSVRKNDPSVHVLIATSTPNDLIRGLAEKYRIPLHVNVASGEGGIAADWNYCYSCAETRLVTITHQDDVYAPAYAERVTAYLDRAAAPLIAFTDYSEIRESGTVTDSRMLRVKRRMLRPLTRPEAWSAVKTRRRILSFGNPVCCPSVTYVKEALPEMPFAPGYRSNIDWQAWEKFSRMEGDFVYCPEILMSHRIHEGSATSEIIADHDRTKEDLDMLRRFWPEPAARFLELFYRAGERQNAAGPHTKGGGQ
ncbi:MAG: glycosyltransferase [Lachnospiraceae bacterium]|jgi:glycosyltransferase involved in cell wall biosynthesis|nr:glycosyltransferase [Lachnospiraceae bacterium]